MLFDCEISLFKKDGVRNAYLAYVVEQGAAVEVDKVSPPQAVTVTYYKRKLGDPERVVSDFVLSGVYGAYEGLYCGQISALNLIDNAFKIGLLEVTPVATESAVGLPDIEVSLNLRIAMCTVQFIASWFHSLKYS